MSEAVQDNPASDIPNEPPQIVARVVYVLGTLTALWAFAGGDVANFWGRLPFLGVALSLIGALGIYAESASELKDWVNWKAKDLASGALSGLALGLPTALLVILSTRAPHALPIFLQSLADFHSPPAAAMVVGVLLSSFGWALISRGILSPNWGIGNVAFLDALAVGFGLQRLAPFLLLWGLGWVWGWIRNRSDLLSVVVSQAVWALLTILALLVA